MIVRNPVIRGFHPDPSICRVGDDYYLASSTFEYFPGIMLFHSRDLVNWERIGYALTSEYQLDLSGVEEQGGVWAPTIRYREETKTFYIAAAIEGRGNLILHAEDPRGPWSDPVWVKSGGIDPSLFFEDGKCYYCCNAWEGRENPAIMLGQVDPDTGEFLTPLKAIWGGTGGGWLEGPHLYHIDGWYYCMAAEGGTGPGHFESLARAKDIYGPYENCPYNPILTNRNVTDRERLTCAGHADLFQDAERNWWMVHLAERSGILNRSVLGRETCLTPVVWKDGWPVARNHRAELISDVPGEAVQSLEQNFQDTFKSHEWPLFWQFVRNPDLGRYHRGEGELSIEPECEPNEKRASGMILTQQPDLCYFLEAEAEIPKAPGTEAGIVVWNSSRFYALFGIRRNGEGCVQLFLRRHLADVKTEEVQSIVTVNNQKIRLWINASRERSVCSCEGNAKPFAIENWMFSGAVLPRCFTGTMIGLFAVKTQSKAKSARFFRFSLASRPNKSDAL